MVRRGIALALLAAACAAPPAPDPWTLWTIDTLVAKHDPAIVEPGAALSLLQSPYPLRGSQTGLQQASQRGLTVFPAFSEGKPAAYMTTEMWQNFDEVWVQPLYVDVTKQNPAIFSVDTGSRFYSPYWQIFKYTHPTGAPEFRDARDVLDAHVPLAPDSAKFCAITRDSSLTAALQQGDAAPLRPLNGDTVTAPRNGYGYAAGNEVRFIDLGNAQRFTFDPATLIVDETPLFTFALPDANGFPVEVNLPRVGGTGPLHHPRCDGHAHAPDGVSPCPGVFGGTATLSGIPEFGALWRVYDVLLPPAADVYVPPGMSLLQDQVKAMGFAATQPAQSTTPSLSKDFILRVAINGKACFASDPTTCIWLDSQNQIESLVVEWRLTRTGTLVTCPLLEFNGLPVPFR